MFTRRRLRSLMAVLLSTTMGATFIGLGANPAEADPNPVEDLYKYEVDAQGNLTNPGPFNDIVVYDNDGDQEDDDCVIEEEPQDDFTIVYPGAAVGIGGIDSPVVVWGNGTAGTVGIWGGDIFTIEDPTCLSEAWLKHLASWGFVVIAPNDGFVGSGAELQQAVDVATWINNVPIDPGNPGPYYQNLDLSSIAAAGHSQGADGAINAAVADSRITSVVPVSTPDEHYCDQPVWELSIEALGWPVEGCVTLATASQLDVPTFFIRGENDCHETETLMRPWFSFWLDLNGYFLYADWIEDPANTPCFASASSNDAFFDAVPGAAAEATVLANPPGTSGTGAGHIDVSEGIGYMTAWLGYMSGNPGFAGAEDVFVGASPEIATNSGWTNWQAKNLPT